MKKTREVRLCLRSVHVVPRVPVEFALEVEGKTVNGEPFNVKAQAVKISRGWRNYHPRC